MKLEFLIILIIRIIFCVFVLIMGFLLGIILEKRKCQKKIADILDEAIREKNENDNPYLLTGDELKRTEKARRRGIK